MNVVDSSGWLEYFTEGPNAGFFAHAIEDTDKLIVLVICVYEVFKRVLQEQGIESAEVRIADLYNGQIVELNAALALSAASISVEQKLAMADSLILATARAHDAVLWTQDEHFKDLPGVKYVPKARQTWVCNFFHYLSKERQQADQSRSSRERLFHFSPMFKSKCQEELLLN